MTVAPELELLSPPPSDDDVEHGANAFAKGRCSCAYCRGKRREAQTRYRLKRIADFKAGRRHPTKHDYSTYVSWGCRCDTCTMSWIAYRAERRAAGKSG
jgi:hypothetical protein